MNEGLDMGLTPLHRAASGGREKVIAVLLADPRVDVDAEKM